MGEGGPVCALPLHTLHPTPYTLHPAPCNLQPAPNTLNLKPYLRPGLIQIFRSPVANDVESLARGPVPVERRGTRPPREPPPEVPTANIVAPTRSYTIRETWMNVSPQYSLPISKAYSSYGAGVGA